MSETYLTLRGGAKVDPAGSSTLGSSSLPVRIAVQSFTGTQLQSGATPIKLLNAPGAGRVIVPIRWHTLFDHAGGTDFTVADDIDLTDSTPTLRYGRATGAIAGSTDASSLGDIRTALYLANHALYIQTNNAGTGANPTGGHAGATLTIVIWYYIGRSFI